MKQLLPSMKPIVAPSAYIASEILGLHERIAISGTSLCYVVVGDDGQDVGILIPLAAQDRDLVIRQDPKHEGYYRIRLYSDEGVIDTLSRIPEHDVYETAVEAVLFGEMGAF